VLFLSSVFEGNQAKINAQFRTRLRSPPAQRSSRRRSDFRCAAVRSAWYTKVTDAVGYAQFYSRSHDTVIRVYDAAGNLIETHEHKGDFKER
jgi:hypothetical protein